MGDVFKVIWRAFVDLFRSRASLGAEILVLRHQVNVLRRKATGTYCLLGLRQDGVRWSLRAGAERS